MTPRFKHILKILLIILLAVFLAFTVLVGYTIYEMKKANKKLEAIEKQHPAGTPFIDFSVDYNGKTTRLSDYVGQGNYVLADFWASWCPPCRAEIPNLIAAYNKYKEQGLVVLGIAVSDEPADTEKAIKELGINYPQIINAQSEPCELYGISGIPHIILFAPDGTIVERGLRGERIEQKLQEIYSKH